MRNVFFISLLITLFVACEKDDGSGPNLQFEYFPLEIGNYWVYEHFDIDSLGNETKRNLTDSVVISRDTIFDGKLYHVVEGTNYPNNGSNWGIIDILRDSSGYLVNLNGIIRFSDENFTDILATDIELHNQDTMYAITYKMEITPNLVSVPAGEFEALNYKGTATIPHQNSGANNPRSINNYYAKRVGKILESYFYLNSSGISEKRLVRYSVD